MVVRQLLQGWLGGMVRRKVRQTVAEAARKIGSLTDRLDLLINNAGVYPSKGDSIEGIDKGGMGFDKAAALSERLVDMFEAGEFDVCSVIYNHFRSVITQVVTWQQLVPFGGDAGDTGGAFHSHTARRQDGRRFPTPVAHRTPQRQRSPRSFLLYLKKILSIFGMVDTT